MKTVQLTPDEVEMIREDIESTRDYADTHLRYLNYATPAAKEEDIKQVNTAESILKKLEAA